MAMAAPSFFPRPVTATVTSLEGQGSPGHRDLRAARDAAARTGPLSTVVGAAALAAKRRERGRRSRERGAVARSGAAALKEDFALETLKTRRGVLPNGMRYVVLRHQVPKGRFEAHLEVHVGSVDEQEDQRGMAHMLEHICFLGSEKRMELQSSGLGMTSNACTDFNHTVYYVNIGSEHLPEGLKVLADVCFQPAFRPERVEKERSAVLSEAQMVNDCQYRLQTHFLSALHEDNCIHTRFPIGLEQQIASWSIDQLRSFHSRWYVPENATLFIVGDIDEEETIQKVEQAFSQIPKAGLKTGEPWDYDARSLLRPMVEGRPEILHRFVQPVNKTESEVPSLKEWSNDLKVSVATNDLMQGMQVTWVAKTPLLPARNQNDLREWLCQRLVVEAVRLRFSARWRSGVIPCTLHSYDSAREAVTITTLTIMVEPSRWQDRCEEVLQEVLTITRHGIAEEELALAKRMCLDRVAEAAASQPWSFMGTLYGYDAAGTSREIVEALIASTPTGHLLTSATRFHEALRQVGQDIDVAQFNDSLQSVLGFLGPAENVRGAAVVSCPAYVMDSSGRKVPFSRPSVQEVDAVLRGVDALDESEAASRRVSAPASLAPEAAQSPPAEIIRAENAKGVTTFRLANGLVVRLLVMPASPGSGPARAGMRLTVPGGRASDDLMGRTGASQAMLITLNNGGAGQWTQDEVQLFKALNSVQSDFRAGADALELDVFMPPTATSCRAALEWLHWALKSPKFDFQGFSDAQLRMKGDALAREKSLEGRSLQAALAHMYPSHRWLGDVQVEDVNRLTLGMAKKAASSQMSSVQGLELDIAVCIARAGESGGLMHEEEFEGGAAEDADEDKAVKEMRKTLEREVERCLGSLPALGLREEFYPPTPSASSRGNELRVHIPDNEARAMVLVGAFTPGYWGRGDQTWQCTAQYKNFSWGSRAQQQPLYPARAMELMMECLNTRLLGRVRDQLSLTYNCDVELTMFEGFDAGHFFCKVFTFPHTLREAAAAAVQVLRSPGWLVFTDLEVEASKKVMAWRESRSQREDRGYWLGRLKPLQGEVPGRTRFEEELLILESLGADDVQLAWRALGGLDDPTVVLTTSGTPDVANVLQPHELPVVEHSDFPDAVAAQQAAAPTSGSQMDFLD